MAKTLTSKGKSSKKAAPAASSDPWPIQLSGQPDERHIRERAYGVWIADGRPHGRELAQWRRAHHELRREAQ